MRIKKILFILFICFPILVFGDTLDSPVELGFGSKLGYSRTHPVQYYSINGQVAYCVDQNTPNPKLLRQITVYNVGDSGYGDGLIAMMNYNLERNYSDALYDAVRVFTAERMPNGNNGYTRGELGSGNHVKEVLKFLEIGDAAANGDTTYLPQNSGDSDIEDNFSLEVIDDSNLNNIRVRINFSSNKPDNFKLSNKCSTSNSDYTCSIVSGLNNNNEFSFSLKGKSNVGGSITVKFNFGNSSAGGQMYDKVYIYGCNGSQSECNSSYPSMSGYQRFLTVDGDKVDNNGGGLTKEVRITVPGVCDDPNLSDEDLLKNGCCDKIDGSKYPDDSKEQDTYIKYCGPVVHMENDCGKDSCNDDGYKAFSHSYVRLRNMKYIIEDLKVGGDLSDYLDYSVNSYCGTYTTEKLDILTPATAASVSGQFFVFDSYNKTDFSNVNAYFRQPFIVERVKSTFFFNYNSWKSNYNKALTDEKNKYDAWQTAVNNVKATFDAWQSSKSNTSYYASIRDLWNNPPDYSPYNVCRTTSRLYNKTNCDAKKGNAYGAYDNAVAAENNAHSDYTNAITTENNAKGAYRTAVTTRTNLQDVRNTCIDSIQAFKSEYKYNFDNNKPSVDFTYSQTSQKEGKTTTTINMVDNVSPVKYWPNTTTNSSNSDYLGLGYLASGTQIVNINRVGNTVGTCNDYSCTINNNSYSLGGSSNIDGCSGNKCSKYEYDGLAYSSIQGTSDATDPYGEDISITSPETISKIYYFRPPNNTFALMNSGEYKTLNYESNAAHSDLNGLEVGYVYNIELTTYKGTYDTSFAVGNYGYKTQNGKNLVQDLLKKFNMDGDFDLNNNLTSTCSYCNMEMAFKRNCDVCDPNDPTTYDFEPQFYYRSISLSDVTPNEREGETNWTDAKGTAAKTQIELGSGIANSETIKNNNEYVALANGSDYSKDGKISTYLADSSNVGKHDIYDDGTREYLEYEVTLTTKDMQMIKRNSSRSYFNYAKMNMCAGDPKNVKDADEQYCFKCNSDMKECESSFVTSFFSDTTGRSKWKYYVNGQYCVGNIKTCIKGLDYTMVDSKGQAVTDLDGIYPDPLFPKQFLERYKNWP